MPARSSLAVALALPFVLTFVWTSLFVASNVRAQAPTASPRGTLTRPPELVQFVEATHPASEAGHAASVVLSLVISDTGAVENATVVESAGQAFDDAAIAAARQFVFSPAEVDGRPSRIRILYRYEFTIRVEAPTVAIFDGVVRDRQARAPLPGVSVSLDDGRVSVTDADGRFHFEDVTPGTHVVTLQGERLTALQTEETLVAGERLDATYDVFLATPEAEGEADDLEIVVTAPAMRRQAVSTEVSAEEARRVPGTQGDVLRVVENLPGVARASLGTGALIVWGAAPDDTGVYVDGVRVPRLYHDGGLRSVVGSDFVRSVELVPGGYGAAFGRGLGGLVTVRTRQFDQQENRAPHGSVSADLYDTAASIHGRVSDRVNVGVGGRYGYVGPLLSAFSPNVEQYFPIPHYWDVQGRVGVRLRSNETLDFTTLLSSDHTTRTAPNADPSREASERRSTEFQRFLLRYARDFGDGSTASIVAFGGADQQSLRAAYGATVTSVTQHNVMFGLRGSYRRRMASYLTVEAGLDSQIVRTDVVRDGSIGFPPREGDIRVFGQPPPDQISTDDFRVWTVNFAPYVEADFALFGDKLHIVPGLRVDPYARSTSRSIPDTPGTPAVGIFEQNFRAEPRIAARYAPSDFGYVTAAFGLYGQQPAPPDLSAAFGNPTLPISRGIHYVLGGGIRPFSQLSIELTGFVTTSSDLAMRSQAQQPLLAEALLPSGLGRSYGAQFMARLESFHHVYGWVSYTLARSQRQDAPGDSWRPSDYDQRHVLTALGGVELPKGWEIGLRVRVATGYPRTLVVGGTYDDRRDLYQPVFGGTHNGIRLPVFFQTDLRVAKHFDFAGSKLDVYLDIQNLTNRQNVEEFIYNANYTERGTIHGLPILPVLGLRWSF